MELTPTLRRRALTGASLLALGSAVPGIAAAQGAAPPKADTSVEEVIVTGSRIVTSGMQMPTPVTVVTGEQLTASKPLIAEALNDLPSLQVGSQRTGGIGSGGTGQATVSLRNLGAGRTLVLLDGHRFIPTTSAGTVDSSLIPNALVQRVDIVTGGASAAYGADAVAGVVNYILDKKYTGFKTRAEYGISERGDVPEYQLSATGGFGFADGRGHFLASAEYYKSEGYTRLARPWSHVGANLITNPCPPGSAVSATCPTGPNGLALRLRVTGAALASGSTGGLIIGGPLAGITFDEGGVPRPFQFGTLRTANSSIGGEGSTFGNIGPEATLVGNLERENLFNRLSFDVNDKVNVYAENLLAVSYNKNYSGYPYALGGAAFTIQRDNAFLPQSIRDRMTAQNVPNFRLGRLLAEFGQYSPEVRTFTWRAVVGADAKLTDTWTLSAYYQHGYNRRPNRIPGQLDQVTLYEAADAVFVPSVNTPAGLVPGTIVCRSTLTNPKNGCLPVNVIGVNSASPAMVESVTQRRLQENKQVLTQDVASVSASGELFSLWAGPISAAAGVDLRRETLDFTSDPWSQLARNPVTNSFGGFRAGNALPYSGKVNVKEYFAEAQIPLLKDQPLAHSLDMNVAGRITDYSTSGVVKTWKVGLIYSPIEDLRFRGTISRDIRAPTLANLFAAGGAGQATLIDPFTKTQIPAVKTITRGNPTLGPERADTYVFGVVYQPSWLRGLSASVDHYDIKINGSIGNIGDQQILDECFADRRSVLCDFIVRDGAGTLTAIENKPFNYSFAKTSGTDFELSYRMNVADSLPVFGGGTLSTRFLWTHVDTNISQAPGSVPNEAAGETGNPKDRGLLTFNYVKGPWSGVLQARYWGAVVEDVLYVEGVDINDNRTGSVAYFDARVQRQFEVAGTKARLSFAVNNLLDRKPPFIPSGGSAPQYSTSDYDQVGRYYRLSLDLDF